MMQQSGWCWNTAGHRPVAGGGDKQGIGAGALMRLLSALCFSLLVLGAQAAAVPRDTGFSFQDMDGKTIRLEDFRGKWVIVNFWAHWCPLCWPEVPALNALSQRKDVAVIGVAMDYGPDEPAVRSAIKRQGMHYQAQVLGGDRRSADAAYRQVGPVSFYPTTYLFGPDGVRRARIVGPLSGTRSQPPQGGGKLRVADVLSE